MTPEPPASTPRRKRRFLRWLGVLLLACFAYAGWKAYDYRAAVREAQALGWTVRNTSSFEDIKRDWHSAFKMETWTKPRRHLGITGTQEPIGHESLLLRLNPQEIHIEYHSGPLNLSILKHLPGLREFSLFLCTELTDANVDQIQDLTELEDLRISNCFRLTHLNPFVGLKKLEYLNLVVVPGIPEEDIKAFKAAHPDTIVEIFP